MFELVSNLQTVPIDPDSLKKVHRGMNKVRVSVGEHTSEQSEVYIITGWSGEELETYIIFYMLEPEVPLVYGCDQNAYDPEQLEAVIEEAVNFVEAMGSILEEVPWETMTPQQRSAWVEKEVLYSIPSIEDLEEIEELEPVEVIPGAEDLSDVGESEVDELPQSVESVIEVSDEEVEKLLSENGSDETLSEPEETAVDGVSGSDKETSEHEEEPETAGEEDEKDEEDIVIADGDFDELLKQAFLKPDMARKTRIGKKTRGTEEFEEEESVPDQSPGDESYNEMEHSPIETAIDDGVTQENVEFNGEISSGGDEGVFDEDSKVDNTPHVVEDPVRDRDAATSEGDTTTMVVRYLSRF